MSSILVVDDDADVRASIRKALERDGHSVTEEPDGQSALRRFVAAPADLVISDVFMPDMDGLDFLARVREVFPGARIIMISGGGDLREESVLEAAEKLGADGIMEKPFDTRELRATVDEALSR